MAENLSKIAKMPEMVDFGGFRTFKGQKYIFSGETDRGSVFYVSKKLENILGKTLLWSIERTFHQLLKY